MVKNIDVGHPCDNINYWAFMIIIFSYLILMIGKYKLLDNLMKFIIMILAISTFIALVSSSLNNEIIFDFDQIIPKNSRATN